MEIQKCVTGKTQIIGLIGNPIGHTLSPFIHNTISKVLGKDLIYIPFNVLPKDLEIFLEAFQKMELLGFNITVPYKQEIMKFINECDEESIQMGAVNTIRIKEGKLIGYNTDGEGFIKGFQEEMEEDFFNKRVVLLGAGGTARSIALKLATQRLETLNIVNRTLYKAKDLSSRINQAYPNLSKAYSFEDGETTELFNDSHIIINTTDVGMYPNNNEMPISQLEWISSKHMVYDVIYNPNPTKFLKEAKKRGAKIGNGLGMLIHQGLLSYKIWTGESVSKNLVRKLHNKMLDIL